MTTDLDTEVRYLHTRWCAAKRPHRFVSALRKGARCYLNDEHAAAESVNAVSGHDTLTAQQFADSVAFSVASYASRRAGRFQRWSLDLQAAVFLTLRDAVHVAVLHIVAAALANQPQVADKVRAEAERQQALLPDTEMLELVNAAFVDGAGNDLAAALKRLLPRPDVVSN